MTKKKAAETKTGDAPQLKTANLNKVESDNGNLQGMGVQGGENKGDSRNYTYGTNKTTEVVTNREHEMKVTR